MGRQFGRWDWAAHGRLEFGLQPSVRLKLGLTNEVSLLSPAVLRFGLAKGSSVDRPRHHVKLSLRGVESCSLSECKHSLSGEEAGSGEPSSV